MVCPRDGLQKRQGDSALHLGEGCGCGWCLLGAPRVQRLALRRHRSPAEAEAREEAQEAPRQVEATEMWEREGLRKAKEETTKSGVKQQTTKTQIYNIKSRTVISFQNVYNLI